MALNKSQNLQATGKLSDVSPEMAEMMAKYRSLEDRKSKAKTVNLDDPANNVRTQRQQIAKLRRDNERLQEDLALETRQAKQANFSSTSAQISKLQDQGDGFARKIDEERLVSDQLDGEIRDLEMKIAMQRREMKGVNAAHEANKAIQKSIRNLESQLDKALVKHNVATTQNVKLKNQIIDLRGERDRETEKQQKLQAELQSKTAMANKLFQEISASYRRRDQVQQEIVQIGAQADHSLETDEEKWRRLGSSLERDRSNDNWEIGSPKSGANNATAADPVAQDGFRGQQDQDQNGWDEERALDEEDLLKKKVQKLQAANAKDKKSIEESQIKLREYEESFEKIFSATGNVEMDVDLLVKAFIQAEETNFALFNKVNSMTTEIEKLMEKKGELEEEVSKYRGSSSDQKGSTTSNLPAVRAESALGPRGKLNKQKNVLRDLQAKHEAAETKTAQYELRYKEYLDTVGAVKDSIHEIFVKLQLSNDMDSKVLGSTGVTESNMMSFLGVIENRSTDLLSRYKLLTERNKAAAAEGAGGKDSTVRISESAGLGSTMRDDDVSEAGDGEMIGGDREDDSRPTSGRPQSGTRG